MNVGLKARLFIAFASIIVLPILTILLSISIFSYQLDKHNEDLQVLFHQLFSQVEAEVKDNLQYIYEPEAFFEKIEPLLTEYHMSIKISSNKNEPLFHSKDFQQEIGSSSWLSLGEMEVYSLQVEVERGETVLVEVTANAFGDGPFQGVKEILISIVLSVAFGIFVLVGLIILWIWSFSKTVLQPLKKIYIATEKMREGNLDYEIDYDHKDEIGRFINGFNLMRTDLKNSKRKQEQLEKNRKELIASISHDLRTPVATIKGYVEGLQDGIVKDEKMQQKYLNVIKTKTDQLDHLIEDLFDISNLELNEFPMEKETVQSKSYFHPLFQQMKMDVEQKGVTLLVNEPIKNVELLIDTSRIEQVVTNLIDNAVRYGGTSITIDTRLNDHFFVVSVRDNGKGIPTNELQHIFNRFYRVEKSRSREHGGTGLGLAISKAIIEAHDGDLTVESELGVGSTFTFTLHHK